jgi:tRNA modification GTPase
VPLAAEDHALRQLPSPSVVVVSKVDLPRAWPATTLAESGAQPVEVSALAGTGLSELRHQIAAHLCAREDLRDSPVISNVRHLALVEHARDAVARARTAIASDATEELVLIDLNDARRALEEIAGRRTADDLLRHVFARFCIGK